MVGVGESNPRLELWDKTLPLAVTLRSHFLSGVVGVSRKFLCAFQERIPVVLQLSTDETAGIVKELLSFAVAIEPIHHGCNISPSSAASALFMQSLDNPAFGFRFQVTHYVHLHPNRLPSSHSTDCQRRQSSTSSIVRRSVAIVFFCENGLANQPHPRAGTLRLTYQDCNHLLAVRWTARRKKGNWQNASVGLCRSRERARSKHE
jgi:hypothetical protein